MNEKKSKRKGNSSKSNGSKSNGTAPQRITGSPGPMNVQLLDQIISLMASNDLSTVELQDGEKRILLKRGGDAVTYTSSAPAPQAHAPAAASAPTTPAAPAASPASDESQYTAIKSIMVGTFYSAPSPEAKPFVSVGSTVGDDTDVCVIEAMKVFNTIKAECRGTVAKVLVTNGQSVEFGQTLFLVKPA